MCYSVSVKDGRKKERTVSIIASCKKRSGLIHALVENDRGTKYLTQFDAVNGICRCECDGNKVYGKMCYHIDALIIIAPLVTIEGIDEVAELESIEDVMAEAQAAMTQHIEAVAIESERASIKKLSDYQIGDFYEVRAFRCKCADPRECKPGWCKWSGPTYDEIA